MESKEPVRDCDDLIVFHPKRHRYDGKHGLQDSSGGSRWALRCVADITSSPPI